MTTAETPHLTPTAQRHVCRMLLLLCQEPDNETAGEEMLRQLVRWCGLNPDELEGQPELAAQKAAARLAELDGEAG